MRLTVKIDLFLLIVSLLIVVYYAVAAVYYPNIYVFSTYEDLYGEWTQTYFFCFAFIFSLLNVFQHGLKQHRWFFLLLAIAAFYVFMEEISWGQRLINFDTPGFFAKNSYQNEANLHNLLTGPVESWTKTVLTYLISLGLIGYGVIFPVALRWQWKPSLLLVRLGVASPPLGLGAAFTFGSLCELELFSFNEAEVAEVLVAMALACTAFFYWLQTQARWQKRQIYCFTALLTTVFAFAVGTTLILLNNPNQRKEIDARLANGYQKFADRYERFDNYLAIAETLQLYDQLKPDNTVILRRIADNYKLSGLDAKHDEFIYRAIDVALKRNNKDPDNVPNAISLAKSYFQVNRPEKVYFYGSHAYTIAKKHYDEGKDRAYWAYWLAKACEQINKQPEALQYYRQAHRLEPDNNRYDRAYHEKKRLMAEFYEEE